MTIAGTFLVAILAGFTAGVFFAEAVIHEARDLENRTNEAFKAVSKDMDAVIARVEAVEESAKQHVVRFITNGGNA